MKKFLRFIALFIAVISLIFSTAACSVGGKTYVFDDIIVYFTASTNAETTEEEVTQLKNLLKDTEFSFNRDGTVNVKMNTPNKDEGDDEYDEATYYWKQSGSRVYIGSYEDFEIEDNESGFIEKTGNGIVITIVLNTGYVKFIFKAK